MLDCLWKVRCLASAVACLIMLSLPLFTRVVPMIHRVTWSLDFGRNITAFIFWSLFCRHLTCRRQDEIWSDMSTKKSVLDDSTNAYCAKLNLTSKEFMALSACKPCMAIQLQSG